jgi:16S rRNA (uracil1498-N3)-methyltransferase
MAERFFVSEAIVGPRASLVGDEARHLAGVLRARVGDEVTLFDGRGAEFAARVEAVGKQTVELSILARRDISRELPVELTLAVALPKGDRQKWLVEKATELGVTRLVPLITERGVAQPVAAALARLARGVIEASKQCGRNRLMEIAPPCTLAELSAAASSDALRWLADPGGAPLAGEAVKQGQPIVAAIGPEGGFTEAERAAAMTAGWRAVGLGPSILRIETAAMAVAAWVSAGGVELGAGSAWSAQRANLP